MEDTTCDQDVPVTTQDTDVPMDPSQYPTGQPEVRATDVDIPRAPSRTEDHDDLPTDFLESMAEAASPDPVPAAPSFPMANLTISPDASPVPEKIPRLFAPSKTEPDEDMDLESIPLPSSPPPCSSGASAPSQDNTIAISSQISDSFQAAEPKVETGTTDPSRFSYSNVVARQQAAAVAERAAEAPPAPLPPARPSTASQRRYAHRLPLDTRVRLPDLTPPDHHHHLFHSHPWAKYVRLHDTRFPHNPEVITSALSLEDYPHIPTGGYLSARFVQTLFPHTYLEEPSRNRRLPVIELMRLEHAVAFRKHSQRVIDQLHDNVFVSPDASVPVTQEGRMPSIILPHFRSRFPVLYQVVNKGYGQGVILEAKDFFVPGPDRRELHLIVLDQFSINIVSKTRGFDRSLLSVKDLVWVYAVGPTAAALKDPERALEQARIPKVTALDKRFPHFFRVTEFTFVTPPPTTRRTFGIIMSLVVRYDTVKGLKIAFESAPEAVSVSPTVCQFALADAEQDEIVSAHARSNSSCAMRFSEYPASRDAAKTLAALVRDFLPAHPEEGLLPLRVFKLTPRERAWIADRAGDFRLYRDNTIRAHRRMTQLFNAACSALVAVNTINDDKRTHMLTATIPSMDAYPFRFDFTLVDMSSECGWTNQRPVFLWIIGSRSLIRATVQNAEHSYEHRSLSIRLSVPIWAHNSTVRAAQRFATTSNGIITIPICVKLGALPSGAEPLYELISTRQLFHTLPDNVPACDVLDAVYGSLRPDAGPNGPPLENIETIVGDRVIELRPDQVAALRMADRRLPVIAIQAAFGTGKTVVGALIAARLHCSTRSLVIATASTNNAVAQFTETLLRLEQYHYLDILRYVSDSALAEGAPQTPIDLHTILKQLPRVYGQIMSPYSRWRCNAYRRGRELLERFLFQHDLATELTDAERDEYRLAERDISDLTRDAVDIMFAVRPPAIICMTTAALLNSISLGGIFSGKITAAATLIGDEASQIPEPALAALATHLPRAHHVYIGDTHQLEPHARCPRSSNPVRFGAQSIMDVLLAKGVPCAPLTTTFRAHPLLNELPNLMFYGNTLVSGTPAVDRQLFLSTVRCPNPELPFLFVDVAGSSSKSLSGSHSNEAEAEVCRQIILALLRKNVRPASLAIIVFYKEQSRLLEHFAKRTQVDIHTVDSVQGREKDIVVLLTTRTGFDAERGEFLNDPHRLNVALSRCRHGQFVLGHEKSLVGLSYWDILLRWARNSGAVTTAASLPDLLE